MFVFLCFFLCGIIDNVLLSCIFFLFAFALLELLQMCVSFLCNSTVIELRLTIFRLRHRFFFVIFGNYIKFGFVMVMWWIRWHFFHIKVMHCYYFCNRSFSSSSYNATCLQYCLLFYLNSNTLVFCSFAFYSLFSVRNDEIVEYFRGFTANYLKLSHYNFFLFISFLGRNHKPRL